METPSRASAARCGRAATASAGQRRKERLSRCRCSFREVEVTAQATQRRGWSFLPESANSNQCSNRSASVSLFQPGWLLYKWQIDELRPTPLPEDALPPIAKHLMHDRDLATYKWSKQAGFKAVPQRIKSYR